MGHFPKTKMKEVFVLLLCAAVFTGCNRGKTENEYGYVFHESTGQNRYILMEGRRVPIKNFVSDASNQLALKSLQALKGNVLYSNAGGDKIFLRGEYDQQSQSFRLSRWYIKVPFEALVIDDETQVPHNPRKVTRQSLERTDFEAGNGFNPNDPAFDPKSFQQAQ
jgi:hypothetical protein